MSRPPSHRVRLLVGTAVAALLALGIGWLLLGRAAAALAGSAEERRAVVALRGLADLVQRAGGKGEGVRAAVAAWAKEHPQVAELRVVSLEDLSLEASTAPGDRGEQAAPRPLSREEKPLYDRGAGLRTAVEANREQGSAQKSEIELQPLAPGGLLVAVPVEQEGTVVGTVEGLLAPPSAVPRPGLLASLGAGLACVLLLAALGAALGERRLPLTLAAAGLLVGSQAFFLRYSLRELEGLRRSAEDRVVEEVRRDAAAAGALIADLKLPAEPPLAAAAWDVDLYRRPLGLISAEGRIAEPRLADEIALGARRVTWGLLGVDALAVAVMLFIGLGGASRAIAGAVSHRQAYAYIAPAMAGMLVLVFFPVVYGVVLSFTGRTLYNSGQPLSGLWVGLSNYVDILSNFAIFKRGAEDGSLVFNYGNFYWTLLFNIIWTVCNVAIGVSVGMGLALVLNTRGLALRPLYRVLLILPWAVPNYITALTWKGMFHRQFGVVNQLLAILGFSQVSWFDRPLSAFFTVLATNGWLSFPFMMVVSLGALQSIPAELYEAARVDGASRWQQFRAITLPALRPALVPAIILSVVWTFNQFNIIYLVSAGDPAGSTEILITKAYKLAFTNYRYGYAAAYSTVIFGVLLVYSAIQNRLTKATEAA